MNGGGGPYATTLPFPFEISVGGAVRLVPSAKVTELAAGQGTNGQSR